MIFRRNDGQGKTSYCMHLICPCISFAHVFICPCLSFGHVCLFVICMFLYMVVNAVHQQIRVTHHILAPTTSSTTGWYISTSVHITPSMHHTNHTNSTSSTSASAGPYTAKYVLPYFLSLIFFNGFISSLTSCANCLGYSTSTIEPS